ncbi:MAG: TetR family transcriptional regulator [Glaciihabitans sp.]|jgi:AcrR family transcriptional regulator|nr:TetR family transcriptional regulator [Glaciihabitans sp.]
MEQKSKSESAKQRLLEATARLLAEQGVGVSTRAICEAAGVTAPTLYHYFGDRDGLMQAVVAHGFANYLASKRALESSGDPIEDIRRGWIDHNDWGTSNPEFYSLMYGQVKPGHHAAAADEAEQLLVEKLEDAARRGLLRVAPAIAARLILAANVGMTLALIRQPDADFEGVSDRLRESTLASVLDTSRSVQDAPPPPVSTIPVAAIALKAALAADVVPALSLPESHLLDSWLDRLAAAPSR